MQSEVKTTCPYCGVGCGILASIDDEGVVTVKGDPEHPANYGRLCSKGSALGETVYLQDRLLYPEIHGEQVSWKEAIGAVAGSLRRVIDEYGPEAVAFYVSGQLLTEDYYVANKLMKGFIGSANIDTNSRLCMSSSVAGHKRAFGEDAVPCAYEDLELADLIVLTGSNTAWCHPVLFQRITAAKKSNPALKVVVIDPRKTQTASISDIHLALRPGSDSILFNGLLAYLYENGQQDRDFVDRSTAGLKAALDAAQSSAPDIAAVSEKCALDIEDVRSFYCLFAKTERVVTVYSQGINQSSSGVDKVNAIINCHLLTGRIGHPGMGPFSFTGQPNAMGGREVGGLANQLAAHMEIENPAHRDTVQRFWNSPAIPQASGLRAVEMFQAIDEGKIKAVWIMATNPVVSMPDADRVRRALEKCDYVIVSDCARSSDTVALADIRLPATTWGERNGTVTNSERCISRQRPFLTAPGESKPDWWIVSEVASAMGFGRHFDYDSSAEIFREHAALSMQGNDGQRQFDIGGLAQLTDPDYEELAPSQWPVRNQSRIGTERLYGDGRFSTDDKRARFIAVEPRPPVSRPDSGYPYILNTGRVRDHWHTMTRTGISPRLSSHTFEPCVEIHPGDAQKEGIEEGDLVEVSSPLGSVCVRAKIDPGQRQGSIFVPMHWNDCYASNGRVGALVKAATDPLSGQPESKHSVASLAPLKAGWHGFIISRRSDLVPGYSSYWAKSRGKGLWRYEIAGLQQPVSWDGHARDLLEVAGDKRVNWIEYFDTACSLYRAARFTGSRLESVIFIGADKDLPPREWLVSLFQKESLTQAERATLLSGTPPVQMEDPGKIICSCFSVGEKTLRKAIQEQGLGTTEEIGKSLAAGTNCGSCLPELKAILASCGSE